MGVDYFIARSYFWNYIVFELFRKIYLSVQSLFNEVLRALEACS